MTGGVMMRTIVCCGLFLSWSLFGSVALAQPDLELCDVATAADVQRLVDQGADANRLCPNGNRPLHQALISAPVSAEVVQALINGGADVTAENDSFDTPLDYSEDFFEYAVSQFRAGEITLAEFNEWQVVYNAINRAVEALSAAQQNLCSTAWWRSATGETVYALTRANPGLDSNRSCNPGNDRPLHIALRPMDPVSMNGVSAILTLVDNTDADLYNRNSSGETPASLLEVRYDRLRIRVGADAGELCENITQASIDTYNRLADQRHDADVSLYMGIRARMGETESTALARLSSDFYGNRQGIVSAQQFCEHRRNSR